MQFDTIEKLLVRCLELATSGDAGRYIENPTKRFAKDLQRGKFDFMPDDEYDSLADAAERLAELWNGMPRRKAGDLLLAILEQVTIPDDRLERIASQLMKWYGRYGTYRPLPEDFAPDFGDGGETKENPFAAVLNTPMAPRTPADIRDAITARVIGQPRAVKAAAMIMYHHLAGRRSNTVFAGPTGCGKSEIWRALGNEYPGRVRIVDFSRMSGDGWVGSVHLRDVFAGIDRSSLARDGLIVVLDEADKILCETAMSSGGSNHNRIIQNNLLKILDGDIIEFGTENGKQEAFSVDCSNVSVVMLGRSRT